MPRVPKDGKMRDLGAGRIGKCQESPGSNNSRALKFNNVIYNFNYPNINYIIRKTFGWIIYLNHELH